MQALADIINSLGVPCELGRSRAYGPKETISVELNIKSNKKFLEKIGFRHCAQKQLRLELAAAYEGFCEQVRRQHDAAMSCVNSTFTETKSIPASLIKVKEGYQTRNEKVLNDYYSLLTLNLVFNRRKPNRSTTLNVFDYKYMETAGDWAEKCGSRYWFDKHAYVVGREDETLPTWTIGIMKKEAGTREKVYDIVVACSHNFVAEGCLVLNCIPSRMTVGQLFESVLGKYIASTGHTLTDATVFNQTDPNKLADALHSAGFQKHGNEVMYHGATGKPIKSMIFIGPTYYQRLKHLVADKIHSRSRGVVTSLYRQPMEGRSRDGG
jgi:hypothetical protein